jgi:putative MATE family efflux protein
MVFVSAERSLKIFTIGLPIMGGMVSNVLLGLVDTAMVGTLGNAALGAVGLSSFLASIYLGLFFGFSIAVQAMVSRRKGEGKTSDCGIYLSGALIIIAAIAPIASLVLYFLIPYLFPLINSDPEVIAIGVDYIRWLILQAAFVGFIQANTGFWNGIGLTKVYVPSLLTMHASNIFLNYVFIFGKFGAPVMGAEGAGFATAIASVFGAVLYLRLGLKYGKPFAYMQKLPSMPEIKSIFRLAIPAGMQQLLDIMALTITYSIVGIIGTVELACYSVLLNLIGLVGLPAWGLGTAGATLVGQALGQKNIEDAVNWAWDVIKIGVLAMAFIGMPFWLAPELILSIWIHDEATLALAILPTQILGVMITFNGIGYMLATMLNGAGDIRRVTIINLVTQWLILVPGAYLIGIHFGFGLIGIWLVHQFAYRAGHSFIFSYFWRQGKWSRIIV